MKAEMDSAFAAGDGGIDLNYDARAESAESGMMNLHSS